MTGRIRVRVTQRVDDLDAERWDALAQGELMMTHRWQRVMEASRVGYAPRYLYAEDARGPLLAATADAAEPFGRVGWRARLLRQVALLVSAPFSSRHSGLVARPDAAPECVARLLPHLATDAHRPLVAVANVHADDLLAWRGRGFAARAHESRLVLDLAPTYDDYVASLAGRQRHELQRVRRRGAAHEVEVHHGTLDSTSENFYPLLEQVCARHGWQPFRPVLFDALRDELPGEVMVFSGTVGGHLAGFLLGVRQSNTLLAILAGLHYPLAYPAALYFVLLDELIRWSHANGVRRIHGGLTNEAQKRRHGFQPESRWLVVRAYPTALNNLIRRGF